MIALDAPLRAKTAEQLAAALSAAQAGNIEGAVFDLLSVVAAIARDAAQLSWLIHYEDEDRDDLMRKEEDELVFQCLKAPFSKIYPELPKQVESVLHEAFDDEYLRLEDPVTWAELNADRQDSPGEAS